jgi:hypothetical protein
MKTKSKKVKVGLIQFDVPRGVYRREKRWGARIERVGMPDARMSFHDDGHPWRALKRAIAWVRRLRVRAAFTEIPLHRVEHRKLAIERRTDHNGKRDTEPRYSLQLRPSKSVWERGWMKIFLGVHSTITQERVDQAMALMAARAAAYRDASTASSAHMALDSQDYTQLEPLDLHPYRLSVADVLGWTGKSNLVSFSPSPEPRSAQPAAAISPGQVAYGKR